MRFRFGYASEDEWRKEVEIFNLEQLKRLCKENQSYVVDFYTEREKKFRGDYDGEILVYDDYLE